MIYRHDDRKVDIFPLILECISRKHQVDIYKDGGMNSYYYYVVNIIDTSLCRLMRQDIFSTSEMFMGKYSDTCEPVKLRYQFKSLR